MNLRQKTSNKQVEVDQTSALVSEPGPSHSAVNLDLPPPRPETTTRVVEMEVDYGPALPPHVGADHHNLTCYRSSIFCCRVAAKERFKSSYCKTSKVIKVCERCFLCRSIEFCPECYECPSS